MYWQTKIFSYMRSLVAAFLGALIARPAGALTTTATVELFTAGPAPGTSSTIGDYTLGGSSGYAAVAPTFSGVVNLPNGNIGILGAALFVGDSTSPFVPATYIGYLVTDGTSTIYGGELFDTPLGIGATGDFVDVAVVIPLGLAVATQ